MSNKTFIAVILVILIAAGGYLVVTQVSKPPVQIIGVKHASQGGLHITRGQKHVPYNSEPASSGPHYNDQGAPAPWGAYSQEIAPEVYVHNEEHGGIVVTYNPQLLPAAQVKQLERLFTSPYSDATFTPSKPLVMPRAADTHAIELAAWTYTLNLDTYNQSVLEKFYLQHVGKSPESGAGPSNLPVIQAGP